MASGGGTLWRCSNPGSAKLVILTQRAFSKIKTCFTLGSLAGNLFSLPPSWLSGSLPLGWLCGNLSRGKWRRKYFKLHAFGAKQSNLDLYPAPAGAEVHPLLRCVAERLEDRLRQARHQRFQRGLLGTCHILRPRILHRRPLARSRLSAVVTFLHTSRCHRKLIFAAAFAANLMNA